MKSFFDVFVETWGTTDWILGLALTGSVLMILYALAVMNRKLRVIEYELQSLRKDQSVMSDELEIVATAHEPESGQKKATGDR